MKKITPVILCGGNGTRLWPRSRATKPKPFLPLIGEETLFEEALRRCGDPEYFDAPVIVNGAAHLVHVEEQLGGSPGAHVIIEPSARSTAAAIALAALRLPHDAIMLVCPSDHHIGDQEAFTAAALSAAALAGQGWLVSFGIVPESAHTGFGYIRRGDALGALGFRVAQFIEKPDQAIAEGFLADGGYSWNSGIFAFRVTDYLAELERHRPHLIAAVRRSVDDGTAKRHLFYPEPTAFARIMTESVDYAVMENTVKAAMVTVDMSWSDIGNWQAVHAARIRDINGNSIIGRAELVDCRNVLVETDDAHVSVIGLENVVVVVNGGAVLVTTAEGAQKVGKLACAISQ